MGILANIFNGGWERAEKFPDIEFPNQIFDILDSEMEVMICDGGCPYGRDFIYEVGDYLYMIRVGLVQGGSYDTFMKKK